MHPLLARQLRKHLPDLDPTLPPWAGFLAAVDGAYAESQQDHAFLEHTLAVTSDELTEANERLRREAENQLASLSRYYQQTLEFQHGMILCVRNSTRGFEHTLCRGQLARRLGLAPEEVEGRTLEESAAAAFAAPMNAGYARAWAGEEHAFTFATPDGVELFVVMRPRREQSRVEEVIASCVEITALKQAEHELRAAKERAEDADRAKSEFLAVMSHEIRTPLNAVLGFTSLLQQTPLNEEQQSWLKTIETSSEALLSLIEDILDFSKLEAGRLTLTPLALNLLTLLDDLCRLYRAQAAAKSVALDLAVAPDVPALVITDAHRLRQLLVNLIGNAVKFTQRGSIRIVVSLAPPQPADPPTSRRLRFSVHDTGIGIPREKQHLLFKPFSQVDSSSTRTYGGTDLGLVICHRLSHLLGGDIEFVSEPGVGSTFSFSIRVMVDEPLPPASKKFAAGTPVTSTPAADFRILVAEDDSQNRHLIDQLLRRRGYVADLVENGRQAVDAARRQTYPLILLDLNMPELDGYQVALAIRESQARGGPRPRIYALTANIFPENLQRCRSVGMDGVLSKPIDLKEFFATISAVQAASATPFA